MLFSKLAITPDINIVKIEIEFKITLTFVSIKKLLNELLNILPQLLKVEEYTKADILKAGVGAAIAKGKFTQKKGILSPF